MKITLKYPNNINIFVYCKYMLGKWRHVKPIFLIIPPCVFIGSMNTRASCLLLHLLLGWFHYSPYLHMLEVKQTCNAEVLDILYKTPWHPGSRSRSILYEDPFLLTTHQISVKFVWKSKIFQIRSMSILRNRNCLNS